MRRILLAVTLALTGTFAVPPPALAKADTALYIVQLAARPALRTESARAAIRANRDVVLRTAGVSRTVRDYETVFNGFAAALTPGSASASRARPASCGSGRTSGAPSTPSPRRRSSAWPAPTADGRRSSATRPAPARE